MPPSLPGCPHPPAHIHPQHTLHAHLPRHPSTWCPSFCTHPPTAHNACTHPHTTQCMHTLTHPSTHLVHGVHGAAEGHQLPQLVVHAGVLRVGHLSVNKEVGSLEDVPVLVVSVPQSRMHPFRAAARPLSQRDPPSLSDKPSRKPSASLIPAPTRSRHSRNSLTSPSRNQNRSA